MKMKRALIIALYVFLGFIGVMAVLPLFFKNTISEEIKVAINKQINGKVDFKEFHISLFNRFPKVELSVNGLSITGVGTFESDTLFAAGKVSGSITLAELFRNKNLSVTSLLVEQAGVLLKVNQQGQANWDIVPVSAEPEKKEKPADTEKRGVGITLEDFRLDGFNLKYQDEEMPMLFLLRNGKASSAGEIQGSKMNFNLEAQVDEMLVDYDSVRYVSNTSLKATTQLLFDAEKMSFTFNEGKVWLNELLLLVNGSFAMPSDSMYFDLQIENESKDFKSLLAMIPAKYKSYIDKAETNGSAEIKGTVSGWYYGDNYPAFSINMKVADGSFHYEGMPEKLEQISLEAQIAKPQGDLDQLVVEVSKATASLKGIPVSAQLRVSHPMTDPLYEASMQGAIDFSVLSRAIPMEGTDLKGKISAEFSLAGHQSDVDKEAYDRFKSQGKVELDQFVFRSDAFKQPLQITSGTMLVTTPRIDVKNLNGNIGQTHFAVSGFLSSYLPYFLRNEVLKGEFILNSDRANLTELATLQNPVAPVAADSLSAQTQVIANDSILAFELPDKVDLTFRSAIKKAVFDRMEIEQINGLIALHNRKLELSKLDMQMLEGKLTVNGSYVGNAQNRPDFDFKMDVQDFDVQAAYRSLSVMRRYLPIAAFSQGKISTSFALKGKMNEKLEFIPSTLDGTGTFGSRQLMVVDNPTFAQLKGIIKSEKLKNVKVDDFTAYFSLDKGNLIVQPFKTVIADQQATIGGKLSVQGELDFALDFKLNRADLGGDINKGLDMVPGSQNIQQVDVGVKIGGPVKKPNVSVDLDAARKQIMNEVKKAGAKEIQDKVKKIGNELKKLFK